MEVPSIFLNRVLSEAAKRNASALHIVVGSQPLLRVNSQLLALEGEEIISTEMINKVLESFLTKLEIELLNKNKEITIVKSFGNNFRFRINIFYQKNLLSSSFFYISNIIKDVKSLKLPENLINMIKLNSGLFIVSGPSRSGKTTLAVAIIEEINKNYKKNIITLEDPIENIFINQKSIISQRQVGSDVDTFVSGLDYCLKQDADIIYISKDKKELDQSIPKILELASGNSLVILEVDADSSIRVIQKIINSGLVDNREAIRYNLADVLLAIINQKLFPKVGGGMVTAYEILVANPAVKSLIREGKIFQLESVIQTSRQDGMISMDKSIEELIRAGEIRKEDS